MSPVMRRVLGCAGLMVLLFVPCGAGLLPLGGFAIPVTLLLAVAMAAVIALLFKEMWQSPVVARIFAFAGLFWLLILFALAGADYLTRTIAVVIG
jgi:caa(3)-type oxidase subunit IV